MLIAHLFYIWRNIIFFLQLYLRDSFVVVDLSLLNWISSLSYMTCKSHSLNFFTFMIISSEAQKFLSTMKYYLPIFSLVAWVFGVVSKKPLKESKDTKIYICFLLRVLWLQFLTFMSWILFWLVSESEHAL